MLNHVQRPSRFTHRSSTASAHNDDDHEHHGNVVACNDPPLTMHTTGNAPSPPAQKKARLQPPKALKKLVLTNHPGFPCLLPEVSVTAEVRLFSAYIAAVYSPDDQLPVLPAIEAPLAHQDVRFHLCACVTMR